MSSHIWLQGSRIWVTVEFLCLIQLIKVCAKGKWLTVAWKNSTPVKKVGQQWRKLQYLVLALAEFFCAGVYCHHLRDVLRGTLAKRSNSTFMSLYQRKRGIGAESEGKRLQSMERKKSLSVQRRKSKEKGIKKNDPWKVRAHKERAHVYSNQGSRKSS